MKRKGAVLLLCLMCLILLLSGILDREKAWTNLTDPDEVEEVYLDRGMVLTLEDGYGEMSRGPWFHLQPGHYRLRWRIQGDGENALALRVQKGRTVPDAFTIPAGQDTGTFEFDVTEPVSGLELVVNFSGGSRIEVSDLRLYSPGYRDMTFLCCLILAAAALLVAFWPRLGTGRQALPFIALTLLYAGAPALKSGVTLTEGASQMARMYLELSQSLSHAFPVRCLSTGDIALLYLPGAMLLRHGASLSFVMNLHLFALGIISMTGMALLTGELTGTGAAAFAAGMLYVLAPYRIFSVFVYGHMAEAMFLGFLPFALYGFVRLLRGRGWSLSPALLLLGATSPTLFLLACLAMVIFLMLYMPRLWHERRVLRTIGGLILCLLSAACLLPELWGKMDLASFAETSLSPAALFLWGKGDRSWVWFEKTLTGWPLEIGAAILTGCCLALYFGLQGRKVPRLAAGLGAAGLMLVFMSTTLFPSAAFDWSPIAGVLAMGWHLLGPAAVCLVPLAAWGWTGIRRQDLALLCCLGLSIVMVLPSMTEQARNQRFMKYAQIPSEAAGAAEEWELYGDGALRIDRDEVALKEATLQLEGPGDLRLPYRRGDALTLNGAPVALVQDGQWAVAVFEEATSGNLMLRWRETPAAWALNILSMIGLVCAAALELRTLRGRTGKIQQKEQRK